MSTSLARHGQPLRGVRVLVVDDNLDHLEIMSGVLMHAGAAVETALSAQEAIEAFEASPHDVIVSDLAMPYATGYNLIRRVRQSRRAPTVGAIAMTAFQEDEHREKALAAGFDEWLAKPATESIVAVVASLVRR